AGIDDGRDAGVHAGEVGIHAGAIDALEDVGVQVDEPGGDDLAADLQHPRGLVGRDARRHPRDRTVLHRHVEHAVESARRVHDPSALEHQIVHAGLRSDARTGALDDDPLDEPTSYPVGRAATSQNLCDDALTMSKPAGRIHEIEHHAADWATTRPVVSGTQGVVATGHPLVSMAGMRMLVAGGNAFDAAVAAGFAAAVIEPTASYTLCGECVALVYDARSGQTQALSGQGTAPALATVAAFRQRKLDRIPTGPGADAHLSFTVPGAVDAYLTLLETHGTRTVSEVLAPAVHYAERGFPMYEYMHRMLGMPDTRAQFDLYPPGGHDVFYPGGRIPPVGALFTQPALAGTLRRLVEADAQARGHRVAGIAAARARVYRGEVAAMIGGFSERLGGLLRASDLAGYRAKFDAPARVTFAGREILGQSVWTQGPVLLQALAILDTLDLRALGHNSAPYIHTVTEALKLAFADRERHYGDPDHARVPVAELLSPAYARERAALLRADRAAPAAPPPGDPWRHGANTFIAGAPARATGAGHPSPVADG